MAIPASLLCRRIDERGVSRQSLAILLPARLGRPAAVLGSSAWPPSPAGLLRRVCPFCGLQLSVGHSSTRSLAAPLCPLLSFRWGAGATLCLPAGPDMTVSAHRH